MTLASSERSELADLFDQVGPDAPTLCAGWVTHDLAAHLWIRENDPIGAAGIVVPPLAGLNARRMEQVKQRWSFTELVQRIRSGPPRVSVFAIPGFDASANGAEYFIHHEDVRRAGDTPLPARDIGTDNEDRIWKQLRFLARAGFRGAPDGVVLERRVPARPEGEPPSTLPDTIRGKSGAETVTLVGLPSELLLYANGRGARAHVDTVGEPAALTRLADAGFGV